MLGGLCAFGLVCVSLIYPHGSACCCFGVGRERETSTGRRHETSTSKLYRFVSQQALPFRLFYPLRNETPLPECRQSHTHIACSRRPCLAALCKASYRPSSLCHSLPKGTISTQCALCACRTSIILLRNLFILLELLFRLRLVSCTLFVLLFSRRDHSGVGDGGDNSPKAGLPKVSCFFSLVGVRWRFLSARTSRSETCNTHAATSSFRRGLGARVLGVCGVRGGSMNSGRTMGPPSEYVLSM